MRTFVAIFIMFFLPLLLSGVPVPGAGGLVAGILGGYLIGTPGRALLIALVPFGLLAIVITALAIGAAMGADMPLVGAVGTALAGLAVVWLIGHSIAMLIGAIMGGAIKQFQVRRHQQLGGP